MRKAPELYYLYGFFAIIFIFDKKSNCMIYIAIDNSSITAKKMIQLLEEMPFVTVYKEFNVTTRKAFKEVEDGKIIKAKNVNDLLRKLKK